MDRTKKPVAFIGLGIMGAHVPARLTALVAPRIAQPVRLGLQQGVQRLLHTPSHDPVEVVFD